MTTLTTDLPALDPDHKRGFAVFAYDVADPSVFTPEVVDLLGAASAAYSAAAAAALGCSTDDLHMASGLAVTQVSDALEVVVANPILSGADLAERFPTP